MAKHIASGVVAEIRLIAGRAPGRGLPRVAGRPRRGGSPSLERSVSPRHPWFGLVQRVCRKADFSIGRGFGALASWSRFFPGTTTSATVIWAGRSGVAPAKRQRTGALHDASAHWLARGVRWREASWRAAVLGRFARWKEGSTTLHAYALDLVRALILGFAVPGLVPPPLGAVEPAKTTSIANYGRPFEPATLPAFLPLPPGQIEPQGWLRDWGLAARDGYTGHLDEFHSDFRKAWAADYRMSGDQLSYWDKGAWPYEGGGYWFDGLVRLGYALRDDFLIHQAQSHLEVVVTNMHPNSILFFWWLDRTNPAHLRAATLAAGGEAQEWPIWANGLLGRALAAYYAASGDPRILRALEMAYGGNPGLVQKGFALSNPWAAFETYTWTGCPEIKAALTDLFAGHPIEAANRKVRLYQSWYNRLPDESIPWYLQPDHGVHFNESVMPWALGYLWTGNPAFLEAASRWYQLVERGDQGLQPSGVPVSDENNGPTGSLRGTETCNVAGYIASQIALLRVGGDGRLADRVERAFFNAAPAVVSRDFKTHVYLQSPNRPQPNLPGSGPFSYRKTHWPLCCTASLNRMLPYYVGHMWMATFDNGLTSLHYGPCKVSALVADRVPVTLTCQTDYPFNDFIDLAVQPARAAVFPLAFRIPGWCAAPELSLNGAPGKVLPDPRGFVRLERLWQQGDRLHLHFPMTPRLKVGHDNDAADTPYATVSFGPLLFVLGIPDTKDANTPDPAVPWNYALDAPNETTAPTFDVQRQPMPARWDWPFASPLRLQALARPFDWKPLPRESLPAAGGASPGGASPFQIGKVTTLLPAEPVAGGGAPERITLIPYGCAKFRISMFPLTDRAYKALERGKPSPSPSDAAGSALPR